MKLLVSIVKSLKSTSRLPSRSPEPKDWPVDRVEVARQVDEVRKIDLCVAAAVTGKNMEQIRMRGCQRFSLRVDGPRGGKFGGVVTVGERDAREVPGNFAGPVVCQRGRRDVDRQAGRVVEDFKRSDTAHRNGLIKLQHQRGNSRAVRVADPVETLARHPRTVVVSDRRSPLTICNRSTGRVGEIHSERLIAFDACVVYGRYEDRPLGHTWLEDHGAAGAGAGVVTAGRARAVGGGKVHLHLLGAGCGQADREDGLRGGTVTQDLVGIATVNVQVAGRAKDQTDGFIQSSQAWRHILAPKRTRGAIIPQDGVATSTDDIEVTVRAEEEAARRIESATAG